jgi:hypothetical protein
LELLEIEPEAGWDIGFTDTFGGWAASLYDAPFFLRLLQMNVLFRNLEARVSRLRRRIEEAAELADSLEDDGGSLDKVEDLFR